MRHMTNLDDVAVLDIAGRPGCEAMLAMNELALRISRRKDPESLKAACIERFGALPDDVVFVIGGNAPHVTLMGKEVS